MKRIRNLLLFVGTALFLAACGTTGDNGNGDGDQNGTLRFALNGVDSAAVEVFQGSTSVFAEDVEDGHTETLAAGNYSVVGGAVAGFDAPAAQSVTIVAGQTATVTLNYTAEGAGNGDGNGEEPQDEPGLYVSLNPFSVRDADTTVTVTNFDDGAVVATSSGAGELFYALDAGLYVVTAERDGYGTVSREVEHADGVTSVSITLVSNSDAGIPGGNVVPGSVEFSYIDVNGYPFASLKENNPEKDVDLLAAQTEDRICVTVSTGVANAIVDIDITNTLMDSVAIVADACAEDVTLAAASSSTRSLQADSNGDVQFSLFSTNAAPWFGDFDGREPIKIVVSSRGANGVADISEFKVFFLNMSHLYFGHGEAATDPYDMVEEAIEEWLGNPSQLMDPRVHTGQRWGRDFGLLTNVWGATDNNAHFFGTGAAQKQPFNFADYGFGSGWVHQDFGGRVVYSVSGEGADMVAWVDDADCDVVSDDCVIEYGSGNYVAQLAPVSGVTLEDLPFEVDVTATYFHDVVYGPFTYSFPLKQYSVSKQWVGGYLTVDKYVDQHVLTWYGHDTDGSVTLDAWDESLITDDVFTSTVHVTVSNDSDSPIYNVAVRDAVPAELGVVTDSISNGGTYDESNHVVTWNFNNTPELQLIEVGESYTFSFDVYARHKPGYCWEGEGDAAFVVQPLYPAGDTAADCYPDPYQVTNGLQANSVTAAGFFENDVTGPQYVFSYSPVADESDIWVVRPLFTLSKTLANSDNVLVEGMSAFFDIAVAQVNRYAPTREYNHLHVLYPWEFTSADTTSGTGHDADSSEARSNPYAHNVVVSDFFDVGLDFTNGTDFSNVEGGNINIPTSTLDKDFDWSPIVSLPVGVVAESTATFSVNLPSFEFPADDYGNFEDATDADGTNGTVMVDGVAVAAWQNCVYLSARQLNQPADVTGTWYADDNKPWAQDEVDESGYGYDVPEARLPALEDCASVAVLPAPPTAFVTLTTNGEYEEWEATDPEATGDTGDFDLDDLRDGYQPSDSFFYVLTAESSGNAAGENVVISGSLSNSRVQFTGNAHLYIGVAGNWTHEETISTTTSTFAFAPVVIPANQFARVVLEAEARSVGVVDLNAELTYDNGPDWQPLPLTVREETSVQP